MRRAVAERHFEWGPPVELTLKGKADPVAAFEALRECSAAGQSRHWSRRGCRPWPGAPKHEFSMTANLWPIELFEAFYGVLWKAVSKKDPKWARRFHAASAPRARQ